MNRKQFDTAIEEAAMCYVCQKRKKQAVVVQIGEGIRRHRACHPGSKNYEEYLRRHPHQTSFFLN